MSKANNLLVAYLDIQDLRAYDQEGDIYDQSLWHNRINTKLFNQTKHGGNEFSLELRNRIFYGEAIQINSQIKEMLDIDLGIADLFCAIVGADSGYGSKPDPDGLLHCCDIAGVMPDASIMVGDTIAYYGAAMAAGCKAFVCIADAFELRPHYDIQPEFVIADLMGLPELMGVGSTPSATSQ